MAAYFAMGGYAAYVWPAYGISAAGIIGAIILTLREWKRVQRQLAMLEALKDRAP